MNFTRSTIICFTIITIPMSAFGISTDPNNINHAGDALYVMAERQADPGTKQVLLGTAAIEYAKKGDLEGVNSLIQVIRKGKETSNLSQLMNDIGRALVNSGHISEAQQWVSTIRNTTEQNSAKDGIVGALIKGKNMESARLVADSVTNLVIKNRLLSDVADGYCTLGNRKLAEETILQIRDTNKNQLWKLLSIAYANAGEINDAKRIVMLISDPIIADEARVIIIKNGPVNEILDVFESLKSTTLKQTGSAFVASGMIRQNRFLDAKPFIDSARGSANEDIVIAAASIQYATARDYEQLEKSLQQINSVNLKNEATYKCALIALSDSNLEKAMDWVSQLPEPGRSFYLPQLAREFGKSEQLLFTQLLIKQINPDTLRWACMKELAWSMARTNPNSTKPLRIIADISDRVSRNLAFSGLCDIYLFSNDIVFAGQAADLNDYSPARVYWYTTIAKRVTGAEFTRWQSKAIDELKNIDAVSEKLTALLLISDAYISAGKPEMAIDLLHQGRSLVDTTRNTPNSEQLIELGLAYHRSGLSNDAASLLRQIKSPIDRSRAISEITEPNASSRYDQYRSLLREIAW